MKVLCDENLPFSLAEKLRDAGIDAIDVRECGLTGADDDAVLAHAVAEQRVLVSMDVRCFGNLIATPPQSTPGLIVVRLPGLSSKFVIERIVDFLSDAEQTDIARALTVLEAATLGSLIFGSGLSQLTLAQI